MDTKTINQLNQLNKDFYTTVANSFDTSRQYFWQGWETAWNYIQGEIDTKNLTVLDVGCGNGRYAQFLQEKVKTFQYLGIDSSKELLNKATQQTDLKENASFKYVDIIEALQNDTFEDSVSNTFDLIVCFGVLHHIPSFELRKQLLTKLSKLLKTDGVLIITAWQFLQSDSLAKRIIPVNTIQGINKNDLEENDYFLDWQRGQKAIRYCHLTSHQEMKSLTNDLNLTLITQFSADSKTNNLNEYYLFRKGK